MRHTYQFVLTNRFRVSVGALDVDEARAELGKALDAGNCLDFSEADGWEIADVSTIRANPQLVVEHGPGNVTRLVAALTPRGGRPQ